MIDVSERAWSLYRQIRDQRARLKSYEDTLAFVRVRQAEAPETVEPVAKALWAIERTPSFTCPQCGARSYNPNDIRERYCGRCHVFVDDANCSP